MINFVLTPHKSTVEEVIELAKNNSRSKIRLFIDLRNSLPVFFDESATKLLLKDPELSIIYFIESVINFMEYMISITNIPIEFNFFYEKGRSEYHKSLNKNYKSNRHGSYLILSPDEVEKAKDLNIKCFDALKEMFKNIPDVRVYQLNYFEADFIPHYVINILDKEFGENNYNYQNVILSNDKDMFQTITPDNSTICLKKHFRKKQTNIINFQNMYTELCKSEISINSTDNFISDILAIAGDKEDGVEGIPKIGYKSVASFFEQVPIKLDELFSKNFDELISLYQLKGRVRTTGSKIFENKDLIELNRKQVDYNIIKDNIPLKTYKEILNEYRKETFDINQFIEDMNILNDSHTMLITYFIKDKVNNIESVMKKYKFSKYEDMTTAVVDEGFSNLIVSSNQNIDLAKLL